MRMGIFKKVVMPILLASVWVSVSEFVRNELLVKSYWTTHYEGLGLVFPSGPANGIVWGGWAILFSISIFIISKKFTVLQATFLSWFVGFVLMWVVVGNLGVLPEGLLWIAGPLSLIETFVAALIIYKTTGAVK